MHRSYICLLICLAIPTVQLTAQITTHPEGLRKLFEQQQMIDGGTLLNKSLDQLDEIERVKREIWLDVVAGSLPTKYIGTLLAHADSSRELPQNFESVRGNYILQVDFKPFQGLMRAIHKQAIYRKLAILPASLRGFAIQVSDGD
jgi:hypothetical protein